MTQFGVKLYRIFPDNSKGLIHIFTIHAENADDARHNVELMLDHYRADEMVIMELN